MATYENAVFNFAVDGATTTNSLDQIQYVVDEKPAIVLISLGGNDVLLDAIEKNFPEQETLENIRSIFQTLTAAGSLVIHLGLNPPVDNDAQLEIDTSRLLKMKDIAKEEGVIFVEDSLKGLWGDEEYMSDSLHPNDKGYGVVCQRVKAALRPHLKSETVKAAN